MAVIIPYQELLGNYNYAGLQMKTVIIIPYQELFRRGALFRFSARLRYTRCCHKGTRLFRGPSPALSVQKTRKHSTRRMFFSPYNPSHCFHPLFSKRHPDIFPAKPPAQPQSPTAALGCISTLFYILSSNVSNYQHTGVLPCKPPRFSAFSLRARPDPFIKRTAPPYTSLEACGGLQYS